MVTTTYTVAAWALILAGVIAIFAKQKSGKAGLKGQPLQRPQTQQPAEVRPPKAKKQRTEPKKEKKEKEKPKEEEAPPQWLSNANEKVKETAIDDREFARQLTSMKTGKKFDSRRDDSSTRQKSVKQSRAQVTDFDGDARAKAPAPANVASEEKASSVSAQSGMSSAEANDSPSTSPLVAPADSTGVADMLEPAPAGPNVLRLVDTEEAKPKQKSKTKAEVKESKKARQNRKKAQQAKELREAEEVERKQKMEAQRRLARVAEGRPAQDGSQFMASLNGEKSAWTPEAAPAEAPAVQLLDTFDEKPATPAPAPAAPKETKTNSHWLNSLPSEEEQMEMVKEDAEWSTVKSKASRKSAKKDAKEAPAAPDEAATTPTPADTKAPAVNSKPKLKATGSFAALSTNDDEEVEEEWDV